MNPLVQTVLPAARRPIFSAKLPSPTWAALRILFVIHTLSAWIPSRAQEIGNEAPAAFVQDVGDTSGSPWPEWITPVATPAANTTLNEISFDVSRPPGVPSSDLLLTLVFDEGRAGFLRVYRQDGEAAETVSGNLSEGTGLPNERRLLLHGIGGGQPTRIVIQADGPAQPLRRLVWEWPRPSAVAVLGEAPALLRDRVALTRGEVSGRPLPAPRPNVDVDYTLTPLLDQPARVDGAASFGAALAERPAYARLLAKVLGLPLDRQLDCWVNGKRVGTLAAALPSLQDPAYLAAPGKDAALAAWREATLYVPAAAWREGQNQIEFRPAPDEGGTVPPYALKDVVLECAYQESPSPEPALPATSTP